MSSLLWLFISLLGAKDTVPSVCQPFNTSFERPAQRQLPTTVAEPEQVINAVTVLLEPGLLQPQIESLLLQHFQVDKVYWQASPHFRWATAYQLEADSYNSALTQILKPFGLQLTLYANRSAVVSMRTERSS